MAFIETFNLKKEYRIGEETIRAVDNVNIKIRKGEFVSILGPSGSGKSTLLHLVGALDRPNKGSITIGGKDITALNDKQSAEFRNKTIGFVFQTFNLVPTLSAEENVRMPLALRGLRGKSARKLAQSALDLVGLKDRVKHRPSELSGGELQRVAIARAIINNPPIILADEPTGNLDSKTGVSIMNLLRALNRAGHTILVVTHNRQHAKIAGRTIQFLDGKIISDQKPSAPREAGQ